MKKNIVFYCHNFGGLGHTNRLFVIIQELINNFGEHYNIIFLNSGNKQNIILNKFKGIKIINLPEYDIDNYIIPKTQKNLRVEKYRKYIFQKILSFGKTEKIIIEHFPFGRYFLIEEIKWLIISFRKYNNNGYVISSVRDIFDFKNINYNLLNLFDRFLIHSDEKIINYKSIFPKEINNKVIYTGYVVDTLSEYSITNFSQERNILVSLGGGQDGIDGVLDFLRKYKATGLKHKIYINLGLQNTEKHQNKIKNILQENVIIQDYFNNFKILKKSADLVVSMGGYNNFIENIYNNKKFIIYPRKIDKEQIYRLNVFQRYFKNIFEGYKINSNDIKDILEIKNLNFFSKDISFLGGYYSASFIYNLGKYEYLKVRLTNKCNAVCDMCGVIKRKILDNKFEHIKRSIIDFHKIGGKIVNFTGGEPTIYKGFWELLFISKKIGLVTSVSTNGSTFGKSFFDNIYKDNKRIIDYIDISVDSLYEKHDQIRKFPKLFYIINNSIGKLKNLGIYIHINVTLRNDNIGEMLKLFNFFKKKGIDSISFGMIASDPLNDTSYLIPSKNQLKQFYEKDVNEIKKTSENIKVIFSPKYSDEQNFGVFVDSIQNKNSFPKKIGKQCSFIKAKKEIRINEGGNITPCCILDDFDERIGNINENGLLNIICGKKYEYFLQKKFPNISKACLHCKLEM